MIAVLSTVPLVSVICAGPVRVCCAPCYCGSGGIDCGGSDNSGVRV